MIRSTTLVALALLFSACSGSTGGSSSSSGSSSGSGATSGGAGSTTSGTGTGTTGSGLCCNPAGSSGTTGGVSAMTGTRLGYTNAFQIQDYREVTCLDSLPDAGCTHLRVTFANHPTETDSVWCPDSRAWMTVEGNLPATNVVGQSIPIQADGGPGTAQVVAYDLPAGGSGSTGQANAARAGTVEFTLYELGGTGTTPRAAGTFDGSDDAGYLQGTFDSANPDCACATCP